MNCPDRQSGEMGM